MAFQIEGSDTGYGEDTFFKVIFKKKTHSRSRTQECKSQEY